MPRIRTIKPEFWDSPGTAAASLRARLFFIALWNWADDWGIGTANPKQLIGFAFPNDDDVTVAEFPRLRTEVAACYGVVWYEAYSRPYYSIPSWDQHQKNERRANRRNPGPDQGNITDTEMRGSSVHPSGITALGTGEQGNRGTGEQGGSPDGPTPFCNRHPEGTESACAGCKRARIEWEKVTVQKPTIPDIRRAPECVEHPGYPLPCDRCAEEGQVAS